jgi:hypothetical protein
MIFFVRKSCVQSCLFVANSLFELLLVVSSGMMDIIRKGQKLQCDTIVLHAWIIIIIVMIFERKSVSIDGIMLYSASSYP